MCWTPEARIWAPKGVWRKNKGWAEAPFPASVQSLQGQLQGFWSQDRHSLGCSASKESTVQPYSEDGPHLRTMEGLMGVQSRWLQEGTHMLQ